MENTETLKEPLLITVGDSRYLKFPDAFRKRYDMKTAEPTEVILELTDEKTKLIFVFENNKLKEKK